MLFALIFSLTTPVMLSNSATKRWKLTKMMLTLCATEQKHISWMKCMMKVRKCHVLISTFHVPFTSVSLSFRFTVNICVSDLPCGDFDTFDVSFLLVSLLLDQSKNKLLREEETSKQQLHAWIARVTVQNLIGRKIEKTNRKKNGVKGKGRFNLWFGARLYFFRVFL